MPQKTPSCDALIRIRDIMEYYSIPGFAPGSGGAVSPSCHILSGVTFISSIGIRHLVSASKALARRGGRLVLLNPNAMVTDVLETSGVVDFMQIARSESRGCSGPRLRDLTPMLAEAEVAATRSFIVTSPGIAAIDRWMEDVGAKWRGKWRELAEDVLFPARVCVAEIATNVLEHGSVHPGRDEIRVALHRVGPASRSKSRTPGASSTPPSRCPVSGSQTLLAGAACAWCTPMRRQ
jgi:STAS domain